MAIHSSGQTIFSFTHIEEITLGTGEEVDEVEEIAGGASGMRVDGIGEVGDRASEGQTTGVYGAVFYSGVSDRERSHGWDKGDREQG